MARLLRGLPVFLFVPILSQSFLPLMRRHFMALTLFARGHTVCSYRY